MKYFIFLSYLIPSLALGQVKLNELIKRNGLSYEQNAAAPYTGKAYVYFPDGAVQTFITFKEGVPNGEIKSWAKKDVLQVEGALENSKRTGVWKLYFDNGKLKKQTTYRNDIEHGEETFWLENGKVQKKGSYVEGKLNGKYEWYYENGQKKQEGFFVSGKEDGDWSEWFESGKKKMTGHFTNFEKHGNWTWWDENGKVTTSKKYTNGLVTVEKDNMDTYLEKMKFYIAKRNYKEALKNINLAEATITDKSENNATYMGLVIYRSKCHSYFFHFQEGEKVLLNAIGLTDKQSQVIHTSHLESSPEKINELIKEITEKDKLRFQLGNHIALSLCYNIIGDTASLQAEQQLMMDKGAAKDWIINLSMALYKLAGERFNNYRLLHAVNDQIKKEGMTKSLELEKAQYLIRTEQFEEANAIVERFLKENDKNLTALLLKVAIEMANSNVDKMKIYYDRAVAIDPDVFSDKKQ